MGAKISGKLVKPNTEGRTLKYFFAPECWYFFDSIMPLFINKDITIEVYECKTHYSQPTVEIGTLLRKKLITKTKTRTKTTTKTKAKTKTKTKTKTKRT